MVSKKTIRRIDIAQNPLQETNKLTEKTGIWQLFSLCASIAIPGQGTCSNSAPRHHYLHSYENATCSRTKDVQFLLQKMPFAFSKLDCKQSFCNR